MAPLVFNKALFSRLCLQQEKLCKNGRSKEQVSHLEISSSSGFLFGLVRVIHQSSFDPVENEPPLVPMVEFPAHFVEDASAGSGVDVDVAAEINLMSRRLDVLAQVEGFAPDREIPRQGPLLQKRKPPVTNKKPRSKRHKNEIY